ncbi:hypothetical protein B7760_05912 (plasmid) [Burkholderia glumae]|nr:hypothetical protein B7760_05912 [Burkholderia glumae]
MSNGIFNNNPSVRNEIPETARNTNSLGKAFRRRSLDFLCGRGAGECLESVTSSVPAAENREGFRHDRVDGRRGRTGSLSWV